MKWRIERIHAALVVAVLTTGLATAGPATHVAAAPVVTSRYIPITPIRVMDTRVGLGGQRLGVQGELTLTVITPEVAAAAGVAAGDVTAVVVNLTAVDAAAAGYFTVWPAGSPRPPTSAINASNPGHTLANLVTVPVGPGGQLALFAQTGGELLADVQGVYIAAETATAGRLVAFSPQRVYDSRNFGGKFAPGETRRISIRTQPTDLIAAVLNITATETTGQGYFTVWPANAPRPLTSNLNIERAQQTIANQVIAGLSGGAVNVYSHGGGHLVIDVVGIITGPSTGAGTEGLFVPVFPDRLLDTRQPTSPTGGNRPAANTSVEVQSAGHGGLPALGGVSAVALNVTLTESALAGYVTVWPARTTRPVASALNADRVDQTISNHVVTTVSNAGFAIYVMSGAHLVADVTGYWIGRAQRETVRPPNEPPIGPPIPPQPATPPSTGPFTLGYANIGAPGFARWDPCFQLRYLVNDDQATPNQRAILDSLIPEVEAATGIDLLYVGETSGGYDKVVPPNSMSARAVFVFADAVTAPYLAGSVAGLGGGTHSVGEVLEGFAAFDIAIPSDNLLREVILHEIGHMLGLAHSANTQVMRPGSSASSPFIHYQDGDREGLWNLGAAQGCIPHNAATIVESFGDAATRPSAAVITVMQD